MSEAAHVIVADTRRWLEQAVIGLNLCPFAKAAHIKQQVHYAVCEAATQKQVLARLADELHALAAADPQSRETTLLIVPQGFDDFLAFNELHGEAEWLVGRLGYEGEFQVASFHPAFQFEGTEADDVTNFTNRSPYPVLHLLREESISRAVESFPHPEAIYEANMETLRRLGREGWDALQVGRSS